MLDGKQYIAVFAGTGAQGRGGPGAGPGRGAPPVEPTAAAAQGKGNFPPAAGNNNPKLLVYAVPN